MFSLESNCWTRRIITTILALVNKNSWNMNTYLLCWCMILCAVLTCWCTCCMPYHLQGVRNRAMMPAEVIEAYKYVFSRPGALTPPINYYRNLTIQARAFKKGPFKKINLPVLFLWVCLLNESTLSCQNCSLSSTTFYEGCIIELCIKQWLQNKSIYKCHTLFYFCTWFHYASCRWNNTINACSCFWAEWIVVHDV